MRATLNTTSIANVIRQVDSDGVCSTRKYVKPIHSMQVATITTRLTQPGNLARTPAARQIHRAVIGWEAEIVSESDGIPQKIRMQTVEPPSVTAQNDWVKMRSHERYPNSASPRPNMPGKVSRKNS